MPILEVKKLTAVFDGFEAVKGVDFNVEAGAIHCVIGPNGAGKSTLLDMICGKVSPKSGAILFNGQDITMLADFRRTRLGIGRKFQVPLVFPGLSVGESLQAAMPVGNTVWSGLKMRARITKEIEDVAASIGLRDRLAHQVSELAHGEIQWLEIGLLLMQNPTLLLLDEPAAGMTPEETRYTAALLKEMKSRHAIVVVEHDMRFVRDIADTVTVLHQGRVLMEGNIAEVQQDEAVRRAYLGSGTL